jgi:hypothetical protein
MADPLYRMKAPGRDPFAERDTPRYAAPFPGAGGVEGALGAGSPGIDAALLDALARAIANQSGGGPGGAGFEGIAGANPTEQERQMLLQRGPTPR